MSKQEKNSSLVENAIREKNLESKITFGKYKGKTVQEVLNLDPSYLVWAHTNIEWFKLTEEIYDEALSGANEQKRQYYVDNYPDILDYVDYYDFCD